MKRWLVLSLLAATAALAQGRPAEPSLKEEASRAGQAENLPEHEDTPGYILHHILDGDEFEMDVPAVKHKPFVDIHFPVWRIPLKAGACPANQVEMDWKQQWSALFNGCIELSLTKQAFLMFLAAALLLGFVLAFSHKGKGGKLVPHGPLANIIEILVLFVRNEVTIPNIGKEEGPRYTSYLINIFFFILFMNLFGLVPWMGTPTASIGVTVTLAICTFVLTQIASIRAAGVGGFLKHMTQGTHWSMWIIMIPVEILGLFTKPFALTLRLFANMVAGHIVLFSLLGMIFIIGNIGVAVPSVAIAVAIYMLELFVAFLQAYIFTILSAIFIGLGVAMGHHGHDENATHETPAHV